jgi:hypothetical protein
MTTLKYYVETYGFGSESERFAAGALPEDDLDAIVYRGIWEHLVLMGGPFYKRKRLSHEEVERVAVMHRMAEPGDRVTFEVIEPADEFDAEEWETLKQFRLAAERLEGANVVVTPFWVVAHCGRKALRTAYARLTMELEGRPYKVEVCLK